MPLSPTDRRFLQMIERLKLSILVLGLAVFWFVLSIPASQLSLATSLVIFVLCGLLWATQRLLTLVTVLDLELTKAITALKHALPKEQPREILDR